MRSDGSGWRRNPLFAATNRYPQNRHRALAQPHRIRSPYKKSGDDGIVITLGLDKDAAFADGLTVVTPQHDFEYGLQILGSADGKDWRLLVDNAAIYDYSRYMAVDQRDIALPANRDRFFENCGWQSHADPHRRNAGTNSHPTRRSGTTT